MCSSTHNMGTIPRHHTNKSFKSSFLLLTSSLLVVNLPFLLIPVGQIKTLLLNSPLLLVKVSSPGKLNKLGELNPGKPTMRGPPLISWSVLLMNTIVVVRSGIINHGDWSDVAPNLLIRILFGTHIVIRIVFQPTSLQSGAPKIAFH